MTRMDKFWIMFLVVMLVSFFLIGCSKVPTKKNEVTTHAVPEEDPILELLIELGEVETR